MLVRFSLVWVVIGCTDSAINAICFGPITPWLLLLSWQASVLGANFAELRSISEGGKLAHARRFEQRASS